MADPTTSAGEAPMYVPPNSAPVLQSLIAEAAALGHWALHEQLCGVLASVDAERARHAEEVANRVAEMRGWGESKLTGAQHEIEHLRDQLRRAEGERAAEFLRRTALGGTIVSSAGLTLEQIDIARRAGRMFVTDEGLGFVYVPGPVGLQPYATDGDELREAIGGSIHETMRSASLNSQGGGGR